MVTDKASILPRKPYPLTEKEIKLIEKCRNLEFGEFKVFVERGQPKRLEDITKSILL